MRLSVLIGAPSALASRGAGRPTAVVTPLATVPATSSSNTAPATATPPRLGGRQSGCVTERVFWESTIPSGVLNNTNDWHL